MKYISVKKPTGEEHVILLPEFIKSRDADKFRTMPYITRPISHSKSSRITHCNYISIHGHIGIYIDNGHSSVSKIIFSQVSNSRHRGSIKIFFRNNKIGFGYNKSDYPDKFYDIDDNLKELLKNLKIRGINQRNNSFNKYLPEVLKYIIDNSKDYGNVLNYIDDDLFEMEMNLI